MIYINFLHKLLKLSVLMISIVFLMILQEIKTNLPKNRLYKFTLFFRDNLKRFFLGFSHQLQHSYFNL